jgi:hypothetical protein
MDFGYAFSLLHYIMKFTGHEDEKMLRHYRTVHKKEVKEMLDDVKPATNKRYSFL